MLDNVAFIADMFAACFGCSITSHSFMVFTSSLLLCTSAAMFFDLNSALREDTSLLCDAVYTPGIIASNIMPLYLVGQVLASTLLFTALG